MEYQTVNALFVQVFLQPIKFNVFGLLLGYYNMTVLYIISLTCRNIVDIKINVFTSVFFKENKLETSSLIDIIII